MPGTTSRQPIARASTSNRNAMTLIELVVSALLAALMMTALTSIVWSSARETRLLARNATGHFPTTQLVQQMRVDFSNARGMLVDPGGITLHGFLGADPTTTRPTLTAGRVRYEISSISGHNVLVRTTLHSRAPVWFGCASLRMESFDRVDSESELLPQPESGGLPDVPGSFRLTMIGEDGQVLWREVMHHHVD